MIIKLPKSSMTNKILNINNIYRDNSARSKFLLKVKKKQVNKTAQRELIVANCK